MRASQLSSNKSIWNAEDTDLIPGSERSPEEEMETQASILAWETPLTEGLVGYNLWGHIELDTTYRLSSGSYINYDFYMLYFDLKHRWLTSDD